MASFKHVRAGTSKKTSPTNSAAWINAVTDTVNHYRSNVEGGRSSTPAKLGTSNPAIVKIKNDTGEDLERGHLVQLGDDELSNINHRKLWFESDLYDDTISKPIALVRSAVKDGKRADAQLIGVCTAIVNVTDITHTHAEPVDGNKVSDSAESGLIEILSVISSTGVQECIVQLGGAAASGLGTYGMVTSNIPAATQNGTAKTTTAGVQSTAGVVVMKRTTTGMAEDTDHGTVKGWNDVSKLEIRGSTTAPLVLPGSVETIDGTKYFVVDSVPSNTLQVRGLATADYASTATTFTLDNLKLLSGEWQTAGLGSAPSTITVQNIADWAVDDNGNVWANWNYEDEQWEAVQAECPA